jgi:hypothetical protein
MSRIKQIKTLPENNINLFKLFSLFVPDRKDKYTETLLRVIKNTPNIKSHLNEVMDRLKNELDIDVDSISEMGDMEIMFFYRLIEMFNFSDLKSFKKFCELNERGLIKQNDLSRYSSFDEILSSLSVAEMISDHKELEKQVKVIFENDEWLLVRPLTFLSSKKYGSNTKWCTTTENNPEYFLRYSKKGVLIYCINKQTGYKVASFYSLDKNDPEFSFWNQKDNRVDSLDTELTDELRKIIYNESKGKGSKTNRFLLSDDERIKEDDYMKRYEHGLKQLVEPIMEQPEPRIDYIRRAAERAAVELDTPQDEVVSENYFLTTTELPVYDSDSTENYSINRA